MNITFFVGNGFDINLGLKTSYLDFYPEFIAKANDKNMIKEWLEEDMNKYKKNNKTEYIWSDLEETLGEKLDKIDAKKAGEVEKFHKDKAELDNLLLDYLEKEQSRIRIKDNEKDIDKEVTRSLVGFNADLTEVGKDAIKQTLEKYKDEVFRYCFICFNYTNTLDQIINIAKESNAPITTHKGIGGTRQNILDTVLHVHGKIEEEMILAVNDADQINNDDLKNDPDFLNSFVKKNINDVIGQRKIELVKGIIDKSHIICLFGMSIGNTDKMWWIEIVEWLKRSKDNKVVIYARIPMSKLRRKLPRETYQLEKEWKNKILGKGGVSPDNLEYEELSGQIFISGADIFKFKSIVA